ncbi:MAG TPA: RNA-guided endonuclease TnpB family protein, partial [Sphingomicrobium sp.]|nr:RNA-guided endonuclease TnpB family protein [Sphingomicrobium sp.]
PTAFDLDRLTKGVAADLGLHSDTVTQICRQFVQSRNLYRRCPRFRASFGPRRALGWIPFIPRATRIDGDGAIYLKRRFRFWKSREVEGNYRSGSFVQDGRGRWYVAFQCEVADDLHTGDGAIGIDLGLKELAALSSGAKIENPKFYKAYEQKLAVAQRARNKRRVKAIHAKIVNSRRHHLHEQSTRIVRENNWIVVGNVNAASLVRTRMAKSVLDAGWSRFRHMLRYKARRHGAVFIEAIERYSSQVCSECGSLPASRPKGIADLGMRSWECSDCGASHDRDTNAARNILRFGL